MYKLSLPFCFFQGEKFLCERDYLQSTQVSSVTQSMTTIMNSTHPVVATSITTHVPNQPPSVVATNNNASLSSKRVDIPTMYVVIYTLVYTAKYTLYTHRCNLVTRLVNFVFMHACTISYYNPLTSQYAICMQTDKTIM